jgi:hypothetical protein
MHTFLLNTARHGITVAALLMCGYNAMNGRAGAKGYCIIKL